MRVCTSCFSWWAPAKQRKGELARGFTSPLEGIYKPRLCGHLCVRKDKSPEGPVPAPGAKPSCTEKVIVWALTVQLSEASPFTHSFGALPALPQIIGARKADPQAGPKLSAPSPYPSRPGNPRSMPRSTQHHDNASFPAYGLPCSALV